MPRALLALAIGAFGIGTTEFVVMGMLPEMADDLGVSVSAVGLLISASVEVISEGRWTKFG